MAPVSSSVATANWGLLRDRPTQKPAARQTEKRLGRAPPPPGLRRVVARSAVVARRAAAHGVCPTGGVKSRGRAAEVVNKVGVK